MNTQEKTAAIRTILVNHEDNRAAVSAVAISAGLNPYVVEAMNEAFKADLEKVFATAAGPGIKKD